MINEVRHMKTCKIQLNDVIYNAAEQCFEAIVTVHDTGRSFKYACAINAPISTSFSDAALGLAKQANRRHLGRGGMRSEIKRLGPDQRAGRPRFDPKSWLKRVANLPGLRAA
jgi:hypothetical protein|tara:strand:+ start:5422 stop:5757 length:336 start_codon:yes stop_codon:yes gene_type:complete